MFTSFGKILQKANAHDCKYQPNAPVPDNILAFRSITMYLSQIQLIQATQQLPVRLVTVQPAERNEARISDAFAQLAVAEHDVVAFATRPQPEKSQIGLLACTNPPTDGSQASPEQGSSIFSVYDYIFTRNPPRKDPTGEVNNGSLPIITSPKPPTDIGANRDMIEYIEGLDRIW